MRFAVLTHDWPTPHLDLLLEDGDACQTWRLPTDFEERVDRGEAVDASPIPRHRLHYLTYEGPVSGDRGTVARWDAGTYERVDATLTFAGERLRGVYTLSEGRFARQLSDAADRDGV